ncbi:MscS family inner membrane protein ynaI [Rhizobium favelukesii]|uniref:MscS family inner membrane protein ynaI n=2 Tax=Rhizobium/Agrobacterium group TaxID=227290 RepID=W6RDA0_9HYPH|nr:MscS family inner membrane protein ynaI [Rhizobium favelukesii]
MFTIRILLLNLCLCLWSSSPLGAFALATTPAEPPKITELLRLLEDADVKTWLAQRQVVAAEAAPTEAVRVIDELETRSRTRLDGLLSAVPLFGNELYRVSRPVWQEARDSGLAPGILLLGIIAAIGGGRSIRRSAPYMFPANPLLKRVHTEIMPLLIFTATAALLYLLVAWPPLVRLVVLYSLLATVAFQGAMALYRLAMAASTSMARVYPRVRLLVAVLTAALAFSAIGERLGVASNVRSLSALIFSTVFLLIVIDTIGRAPRSDGNSAVGRAPRAIRIGAAISLWLLWCCGFVGLFWIGIMIVVVPRALSVADKLTSAFAASHWNSNGTRELKAVMLVRVARAVIVIAAADWIAFVWHENFQPLGDHLALAQSIVAGVFNSVVILLVFDLIWQLGNAYIARKLSDYGDEGALDSNEMARQSRIRTLLPVFRNTLAAGLLSVAVLTVLSQMGVQIGPLIAGAGVVGVALGFGSQTLVKDIVSGVFYLLDDAFRVGEYIEAGSYAGVVESFSLRSVRLRHYQGPIFTVPFGTLGAIKNSSRDWAVDKFRFHIPFKTDLDKVSKLIKDIGVELEADPEFKSSFIKPLKLTGVEKIGEYGIEVAVGFTCKLGEQTSIRRKAYTLLMQTFGENDIDFAQPMVQVNRSQ